MKIDNPETFRANVVKKFTNLVGNEKKAYNIEKSIFNYTVSECKNKKVVRKWENKFFVIIYVNKMRSLWMNLKNDSYVGNETMLTMLKNGDIKTRTVAFLTHQEMYPEIWKDLIDAKIKRDQYKFAVDKRGATGEFKCKKCKQRECSYTQLQTRSADEPMTTFVTCLNCGNFWRC